MLGEFALRQHRRDDRRSSLDLGDLELEARPLRPAALGHRHSQSRTAPNSSKATTISTGAGTSNTPSCFPNDVDYTIGKSDYPQGLVFRAGSPRDARRRHWRQAGPRHHLDHPFHSPRGPARQGHSAPGHLRRRGAQHRRRRQRSSRRSRVTGSRVQRHHQPRRNRRILGRKGRRFRRGADEGGRKHHDPDHTRRRV